MIKSTDIGSISFEGNSDQYVDARTKLLYSGDRDALEYVGSIIVKMFIDKAKRIDEPTYPQIANEKLGMNEMFLQLIDGIEKSKGGYEVVGRLNLKQLNCYIPEVHVLEKNSAFIAEKVGRRPVEYSICLTDPHCLSWAFANRSSVNFEELGYILAKILEETSFSNKYMRPARVSVDDPLLGVSDDLNIDILNAPKREELRKSWEIICDVAKSKGATTSMHLHSTTDKLFWDVDSLEVVQAHVDDHLYTSPETKGLLKDTDKKIFASICKTDPNTLIDQRIRTELQRKGETVPKYLGQLMAGEWKKIKSGEINPVVFLELEDVMKKRLLGIGENVGWERVVDASPECGLPKFSYKSDLEYLRRVGDVVRDVNEEMRLL